MSRARIGSSRTILRPRLRARGLRLDQMRLLHVAAEPLGQPVAAGLAVASVKAAPLSASDAGGRAGGLESVNWSDGKAPTA